MFRGDIDGIVMILDNVLECKKQCSWTGGMLDSVFLDPVFVALRLTTLGQILGGFCAKRTESTSSYWLGGEGGAAEPAEGGDCPAGEGDSCSGGQRPGCKGCLVDATQLYAELGCLGRGDVAGYLG